MDYKFILRICFITLCFIGLVCYAQDTFYFSQTPKDKSVVEGTETVLLCDVNNRRHIIFDWIQSGKPVTNTSRRFQEGSYLRILRVTRDEDAGPFQCIATNITSGFSLQSREATLNIQWIDQKATVELKRPKAENITLGSEILLKCQITGNPEPTFLWYHNKFRLFNTDRIKIVDGGNKVRISNINAEDNGIYSCRSENVAGAIDSTGDFLLNKPAPGTPHLIEDKFTRSLLVMKNDPAWLDCPFVNAHRIDWFSTHEKITNNTRHTVYPNGTLYFPRVRPADEGSYRCEGLGSSRDIPAQTFTSELMLTMLEDFRMDSFEPRLIPNFPIVVPIHKPFTLKVFQPDGQPKPSISWFDRNGDKIGTTGNIFVDGNNLVFKHPAQIDTGNYTCRASNLAGIKNQTVWTIVSVPPVITRPPQDKEVEEDGNVDLQCQVEADTAYPITRVIWMKNGLLISSGSSRHHMDLERGILRIPIVSIDDAGTYACVANTTGQDLVISSEAYLRVTKKLKFHPVPQDSNIELHKNASLPCKAEGDGQVKIRWFKDRSINIAEHITNIDGTLTFLDVQRSDSGRYTCMAYTDKQGSINSTINIDVVVRPKFRVVPMNTTVLEGQSAMIHCVAIGEPKPMIFWDKNFYQNSFDPSRIQKLSNGTLHFTKVYMEDKGRYGCTANNTAGNVRMEANLNVASASEFGKEGVEEEEGIDMVKTIIIAVCSAGAYFALVIALTAYFSYRLFMRRKRFAKSMVKSENGDANREQHELLVKDRDSESRGQLRSDSDNRSHVSGMSSHPSHSSQSQSTTSQSQSQRSRRGSYDRLVFPRHDLATIGMLGKGLFGDVFLAKARGIKDYEPETLVVVKSLLVKDEHLYYEFKQELDMYSKLDHPCIAKILGVCKEIEPQFVITEYCDWGDLKQFLYATRGGLSGQFPRVPPLTAVQKTNMCHQVASGLEHLSNHRYIHRDIASRNVLLTSRLELKITSLSLCRDAYAGEYYPYAQNLIPLRWMPPEAVFDGEFSVKSDIWAFGIFVWEVFHLGDLPYTSLTDDEVLKHLKIEDLKLTMVDMCPQEIIDLITKCTAVCPKERPLFSEICSFFGEYILKLQSTAPV
ncbi:inactive tyrosine-protein kinase 7-like [Mytilus galloprovincialis]|uniref:receptor protein-tyrosine kinase n=1 Tax=Mytilus galloprovincialis TaxID=29158 RepID=A0A8B6D527_MYTGA|nr:PTK7 protein tyrosine kinase 7 [Mytilus galloprovincialis]